MPEKVSLTGYIAYEGTITFDSAYDYDIKEKKINDLTMLLSQCLRHTLNSDYHLNLVREYHKVSKGSDIDDPESPHYHFILYSKNKLSVCRVRGIFNTLREFYGRCQFHILTTLRLQHYQRYIYKDVQKNDETLGFEHAKWMQIGPYCGCKNLLAWEKEYYKQNPNYLDDELSDIE